MHGTPRTPSRRSSSSWRKAGAIRRQALLGPWLYGVAWRVAVRLRGRTARRRKHERAGVDLDALPADDAAWSDVRWVVQEEVQRLPDVYRSAIILCCLEGKTNEEAARLLRRPVGTVKSRLTRARELLRTRLTRRGMTVSVGALGTVLAAKASMASAALADATVRAALPFAAGGAAVGGVVSARAVALSQGVLRTMLFKKVTFAATVALVVVLFGGVGGLAYHSWAAAPGDAPKGAADAEKPPAADPPKDGATKDKPKDDADAQKIQGMWVAVSAEMDGKPAPAEAIKDLSILVTADKMAFNPKGEDRQSLYKLDPTTTPKGIELTPQDGPAKGKTVHGLYELDGDRLKLCLLNGPGEEPKAFATTPGSNLRLLILKRKPADDKPVDKPKDDKEALQGTWRVISVEVGSKEATDKAAEEKWVVKDSWITAQSKGLSFFLSAVFAVRSDESPKEIDINPYPIGAFAESDIDKGIYTLDGDEWKVCLPHMPMDVEGGDRPKEMATKDGGKTILITLRRVKPDQDKR